MQDWLTLDGRPTLVCGAGGLGGASALSLAAQGARVALVDVNQDKLDAIVRAAKEAGYEIKPLAIGLAAGIIFDATVIRALLVPSVMKLLGDWNWWMPTWTRKALFVRDPESIGKPAAEQA